MLKKSNLILLISFLITGTVLFLISLPTTAPKIDTNHAHNSNLTNSNQIQLDFGHDMDTLSPQHKAALEFANIVAYKTNNRVKINIFPNNEIGNDHEMVLMAQEGRLAITLPPTSKISTLVPEMQFLDIPFYFNSKREVYNFLDGEPGQYLLGKLEQHGLIGVDFWEGGFKQITSNSPIHSPQDFKGLKIRIMKSQMINEKFKLYGANPIPINFKETYKALKEGAVDGQENPLTSIYGQKFYEHQSHLTLSNHAYLAQAIVFSKKIYSELPKEIQKVLFTTLQETTDSQREKASALEATLIEKIQEKGTLVHELSDEEKNLFKESSKSLLNNFSSIGDSLLKVVKNHSNKNNELLNQSIIIGLNADLSASSKEAGYAIKRGIELAIAEINENGGVLGKELSLIEMDNTGISKRGINNIIEFSKIKNLVAVMCGIYSPIALATLEQVHSNEIILLSPWAAATRIIDNDYRPNYAFRASVRDQFAAPFLVKEAVKKYKRIALLLVNDGWGKGNHKGILNSLKKYKLEPVAVEFFNWGEVGMNTQLKRIKDANADAIILVAGSSEGASIVNSMVKDSINLPIISHWGVTGGNFSDVVKKELNIIDFKFLQSYSFFNKNNEKSQKLIHNYHQRYNTKNISEIFSPVGTAQAYDLVYLLSMAISEAQSLERPKIRNALEHLPTYHGVVKTYNRAFSPSNHDALDASTFFLAKYDSHGSIIPLKD